MYVYRCLCVFGCKSKATCPLKNRRCVGVVTVDLSSCVSMGVYGFLWVSWVFLGVRVFMGVYRCLRKSMGVNEFSDVNRRRRVL